MVAKACEQQQFNGNSDKNRFYDEPEPVLDEQHLEEMNDLIAASMVYFSDFFYAIPE
ncbi:hypothetical protein [Peribacillus butanolivorans]|uniref:hypothetical protein n=1 Tax=Peribacillus butanolivorans TaxID=421767 RepID=UPI0036DADF83